MASNFKPTREAASDPEETALNLLAWLAGEPELIGRFLALSGVTPAQVASAARDPAFLGGVLDFVMANEGDLMAFCAATGARPETVAAAWRHFSGAA